MENTEAQMAPQPRAYSLFPYYSEEVIPEVIPVPIEPPDPAQTNPIETEVAPSESAKDILPNEPVETEVPKEKDPEPREEQFPQIVENEGSNWPTDNTKHASCSSSQAFLSQ